MIEAAQSQNMMCVAIHWPGATAGRRAGLGGRNKDNNNTVLKVVPDIIEASLARQTKTEDRSNIIWVKGGIYENLEIGISHFKNQEIFLSSLHFVKIVACI